MKQQPTALVIFGATGDLTQRKIYPSLYKLAKQHLLPKEFFLFGVARESLTDKAFLASIRKDIYSHISEPFDEEAFVRLTKDAQYISAELKQRDGFDELECQIGTHERRLKKGVLRLFYLALPPSLFADVISNVETCHLGNTLCTREQVLSRVIVEKPFGHDVTSSRQLERLVSSTFREEQIFRIDHYLGKEAVQNVLTFRKSNPIFEAVWNAQHIETIHIDATESIGLEDRGAYYDHAGAIRDMVQSHLLQLLAFVTMDIPRTTDLNEERAARANLLKHVSPFSRAPQMTLGQYRGYLTEPGVRHGSRTETFAALALKISTARWKGVPFFIRTGKRLQEKSTTVTVTFKSDRIAKTPNRLTFKLDPRPAVTLAMNVVGSGFTRESAPAAMHYCRNEHFVEPPIADYERLLLAALHGDSSLFVGADEVLASWQVVEPYLQAVQREKLSVYKPGSNGPATNQTGAPWPQSVDTCPYD